MKKNNYELAKLKRTLFQMRNERKKNPIWKLSREQREFIEGIGFPVEGCIYEIKTKRIENMNGKNGLLKEIHFSYLKHKNAIYKKLTRSQIKFLGVNGFRPKVYKYEIRLDKYAGK